MSSNANPSPIGLTPQELSKLGKKDLAKHLTTLQGMYTEQGRKYDKAKSIIRSMKATSQAKSVQDELIPKPAGRRSRDFNIFEEMQHEGKVTIDKDTYNNLIDYIHKGVNASNFNMDLSLTNQETAEVVKVVAFVAEKYPFVAKYRNAWPVRMLMQQYMANHRANLRAKRAASKATPADTGRGSVDPPSLDLNDTEGNGDEHCQGHSTPTTTSSLSRLRRVLTSPTSL
ncbi:hypothetical protein BJ322DRAFT_1104689 [Thelephora terrestris]|uniref:Uncharacterized protein n=1 Tax=Thelephora terrestris TaxID=56493 RepID=A0A9P6HNL2_9AGAM|nr:hypothetical protein BJ322DRAFT_1104689 [Thelephora terrestris]